MKAKKETSVRKDAIRRREFLTYTGISAVGAGAWSASSGCLPKSKTANLENKEIIFSNRPNIKITY